MATQKERVAQAVDTAIERIADAGGDATAMTAEEALEYVEGYEPEKNELRAFRKAFNERQEELDEGDTDITPEDFAVEEEDEDTVESEEETVVDPFADDDTVVPESTKVDDRRAAAIERAREILGDEADTVSAEEAIIALRKEGHPFYGEMRASASQASKFIRDYKKTQPGGDTRGGPKPLRKSVGFQEDLQEMRSNLSTVRKTTEKGEAIRLLNEVKEKAEGIIAKVEASEES